MQPLQDKSVVCKIYLRLWDLLIPWSLFMDLKLKFLAEGVEMAD